MRKRQAVLQVAVTVLNLGWARLCSQIEPLLKD